MRLSDAMRRILFDIDKFHRIDPSGRILFKDDMEDGTTITARWTTVDGTIAAGTDLAFMGKQSLKLTTAGAADDVAQASRAWGLGPQGSQKIGVEFWWASDALSANITEILIQLKQFDGTNVHTSAVKYLGETNEKWQYLNTAGVFVDVVGGAQLLNVGVVPVWHAFKLSADLNERYYGILISDNQVIRLKGIQFQTAANAADPYTELLVGVEAKTATAVDLWVDNLVVTSDEDIVKL